MPLSFQTPGVYRQETSPAPVRRLLTGVPGFVGFAKPAAPGSSMTLAVLTRPEDLATLLIAEPPASYLATAIRGFFVNGGSRCVVSLADSATDPLMKAALDRLAGREDIDLVALPDAMTLTTQDAITLQRQALDQCAQLGNRVAILDSRPAASPLEVIAHSQSIKQGLGDIINGALYYPWIALEPGRFVPPCGHIAGIIAATDAAVGVFKAPANALVSGAIDLQCQVVDSSQSPFAQGPMNMAGINCLRAMPGRGIRVWGARTLSNDPAWTYLSVRRLFLTLSRWIDLNLGWVVFEPNNSLLWARIERDLRGYLGTLWQAGGLVGDQAGEAFFVRCDAGNNPAASRDAGQLMVEIGMAATQPTEFITVRINLRAAEAEAA